jgi:nucleoside-diphosphate-sugar epimerase
MDALRREAKRTETAPEKIRPSFGQYPKRLRAEKGSASVARRLFAFGLGFSAQALAERLASRGWYVAGTTRDHSNVEKLRAQGYTVASFAGESHSPELVALLQGTTHLLHSIPPGPIGDLVFAHYRDEFAAIPTLEWMGYLSTVGVYGDQEERWVDETTPPQPNSASLVARLAAEKAWLEFGEAIGRPVQIFRLAGIYGPGRNVFDKLRDGTAQRVKKNGQVFSRVHVEDIAAVLEASMGRPRPGAIYNVADDEPAAPDRVVAYAADLLGVPAPPEIPFEKADLSSTARSFYEGSRRVRNSLIKSELGITLLYPTYREGLAALLLNLAPDVHDRTNTSGQDHLTVRRLSVQEGRSALAEDLKKAATGRR